ncbi:MAG: hypothetical protein ACREAK_03045 [Nitrosarchaeum sp.]
MVLITNQSNTDKILKILQEGFLGKEKPEIEEDIAKIKQELEEIKRKMKLYHSKELESLDNLSDKVDRVLPEDSELSYGDKDY